MCIASIYKEATPVPVLNPTLTLMLGLLAKHSDIFHCLHKGKLLVSSR